MNVLFNHHEFIRDLLLCCRTCVMLLESPNRFGMESSFLLQNAYYVQYFNVRTGTQYGGDKYTA